MKLNFTYRLLLDNTEYTKSFEIDDKYKNINNFSIEEVKICNELLQHFLMNIKIIILKEFFDDDFENKEDWYIFDYFSDSFESSYTFSH